MNEDEKNSRDVKPLYHIVCKNKEGVFLLDKSQTLLWSGYEIEALPTWETIKRSNARSGKLYLVRSSNNTLERQFLDVIAQY